MTYDVIAMAPNLFSSSRARKALSAFILLTLIFSSVPIFMVQPVSADSAWADADYSYRKAFIVAETAGAGTNYQIKLTLNNAAGTDSGSTVYLADNVQDDFDDIRFYADDQTTPYDFWVETYTSNTTATVWVEVQGNLTAGDVTCWLYYGDADATGASNGTATFLAFDDFNDNSISDSWAVLETNADSTQTETSSQMQLYVAGSSWKWSGMLHDYTTTLSAGFAVVVDMKYDSGAANGFAALWVTTDNSNASTDSAPNALYFDCDYASPYREFLRKTSGSSTSLWTETSSVAGNTAYHEWELRVDGTNCQLLIDETSKFSGAHGAVWNTSTVYFRLETWGANAKTSYFDDFYVRKSVATEPSISSWGSVPTLGSFSYAYSSGGYAVSALATSPLVLSGFILSTNITGEWVNGTWTPLTGTSAWMNESLPFTYSSETVIGIRYYANNSEGWADSGIKAFTASSPDGFSYAVPITVTGGSANLTDYAMHLDLWYSEALSMFTRDYESSGVYNAKVAMVDGSRYILTSTGWGGAGGSAITVYAADSDWIATSTVSTSSFSNVCDMYAYTFPEALPGCILVSGTLKQAAGFIAVYNITADSWSYNSTANTQYFTNVAWVPEEAEFFLQPVGGTWANKLVSVGVADLFNNASWATHDLPYPGFGTENRFSYHAGDGCIYITQGNSNFKFLVYRWNITANTFDTLFNETTDETVFTPYGCYSYVTSNGTCLFLNIPFSAPAPYARFYYSLDNGATWVNFLNNTMVNGGPDVKTCVNKAVFFNGSLWVYNLQDGYSGSYVVRYDSDLTTVSQNFTDAVTTTETNMVADGNNIVMGGEGGEGGAQANVYFYAPVDADGGYAFSSSAPCNADFSDIRIFLSDNMTQLPVVANYIASGYYASLAAIFPYIPASGTVQAYLYFGNASALSCWSDPDSYAAIYDSFNDNSYDTDLWTTLTGSGAGSSTVTEESGALLFTGDGSKKIGTRTAAISAPYTIEFDAMLNWTGESYSALNFVTRFDGTLGGAYNLPANSFDVDMEPSNAKIALRTYISSSGTDLTSAGLAVQNATWYHFSISDNGSAVSVIAVLANSTHTASYTSAVPNPSPQYLGFYAAESGYLTIDNFIVYSTTAVAPSLAYGSAGAPDGGGSSSYTLTVGCFTITSAYPLYSGTWTAATETLAFIGNYSANVTNTCGYGYPAGAGPLSVSPSSITMSSGTLIIVGIGVNATFWVDYSFDYITWNITGDASDAEYDDIFGELEITGCGNFTIDASTGLPSGDFFITVNGSTWDQWTWNGSVIWIYNVPCPNAVIVVNFNLPGEEHHCSTCGGGPGTDDLPQGDNDGDGIPDSTDPDDDDDGIPDALDERPFNWDPPQDTPNNETDTPANNTLPTQQDFNNAVDSAFGFVPAEVRPVVVFTVMGLPVILLLLLIVGGGATIKGAARSTTARRARR